MGDKNENCRVAFPDRIFHLNWSVPFVAVWPGNLMPLFMVTKTIDLNYLGGIIELRIIALCV